MSNPRFQRTAWLNAVVFLAFVPCTFAQPAPASRPTITGISHLVLFADDFPKSERFYVELHGWGQVPPAGAKPGVRFYANHSQYVELAAPPKAGLADRLDLVAFSTSDADELRKYLGANGVAVPKAVTVEADGSRSFVAHDPEGNKVGFTQDGKHPLAEPASASKSVSNHIMHAGYVVRNRAALDHFYKDLLGFHLYWQGGNPDTRVDWVMMQVPEWDGLDRIHAVFAGKSVACSTWERQSSCSRRLQRRRASAETRGKGLEARAWQRPEGAWSGWEDAVGPA